ncbi:MAG: tRNA preQ1(34) S-adenosylmethionine ribosyltransferase-isomerase QueA [Patescibacteria group bacterium]|jgi:S-adenosylmethionine:tRNA ribosyltransferase-isomerase
MTYKVEDFNYYLPPELIAQKPIRPRDHSRLLLLDRTKEEIFHRYFYNIVDYLRPGDLLVLNNSKVFPARLLGKKAETGGSVEIFLHKKIISGEKQNNGQMEKNNIWECLVGGRVKIGLVINFSQKLQALILKNNSDGTWLIKFNLSGENFWQLVNKIGEVPLPPYIKRLKKEVSDKNNYQTVFADNYKIGSVAAPTAGLHFTKALLKKIKARGVKIEYITLHVGLGTFAPMKTENITDHRMHSEFAEVSARTSQAVLATKKKGGRVIAVGTTTCRTLESINWPEINRGRNKSIQPSFWTGIFIYPGYHFKIIDALITNFHLPKSTLLLLVSALAGKNKIDRAYQEAIDKKYRFFSYGDAMFIY